MFGSTALDVLIGLLFVYFTLRLLVDAADVLVLVPRVVAERRRDHEPDHLLTSRAGFRVRHTHPLQIGVRARLGDARTLPLGD